MEIIDPKIFFEFFGDKPELWSELIGQRIFHKFFEEDGIIQDVKLGNDNGTSSIFSVKFDDEVKSAKHGLTRDIELDLTAFDGEIITRMSISPKLSQELKKIKKAKKEKELEAKRREAERRKQKEREREARNEYIK